MNDPFQTFGPPELCTWRYTPGVCRFQTTEPRFARKLSQRSRARLVAWSVNKKYLRIFQEEIQPWRARRLVTRYLKAANEAFLHAPKSQDTRLGHGKVTDAVEQKNGNSESITSQNATSAKSGQVYLGKHHLKPREVA